MVKKIKVEEAIGLPLAHDITEIIPGKKKHRAFKRGYKIKKEDIPRLYKIGRSHIHVYIKDKNHYHEEEAAILIARYVSGKGTYFLPPSEGRVNIKAKYKGLFVINKKLLYRLNKIDEITISTIHNYTPVEKDALIVAEKVTPLEIRKSKIEKVKRLIDKYGKLFFVEKYKIKKAALIITGNEVASGLIKDGFYNVLKPKLKKFDVEIVFKKIVPDDIEKIKTVLKEARKKCNIILVTGGMSVDPDDVTKIAIKEAGIKIVKYGTPVLPGAMFLYGEWNKTPVIGVPGGALFDKATALDVFLPPILAGIKLKKEDFAMAGYGGLCIKCKTCWYPVCPFGKW